MLYLTRKIGEAIIINDVIEVTLIEIQGRSVKLGFQFPETEKVLRRELYDKIKAEIHSAAKDVLTIQKVISDKGSTGVPIQQPNESKHLNKSKAK